MKCDELTPIDLECNMGKDVNGVEHRLPWKAYDIDEVNAAIAELKAQLESEKASRYAESVDAGMRERRLKRELWLTRGAVHKANRKAMYGLLQAYPLWEGRPAGLEVHKNIHRYDGYERKCLAKAEEYK